MTTKIDSRQVTYKGSLLRVATTDPTELDNIISSLDAESTPPLMMRADTATARLVDIGGIEVTNPETGERRTIPPINGISPTFASGSLQFPTAGGGTITVTPGTNVTMPAIAANEFMKVGVYLNDAGNLELSFGTAAASEAAAGDAPDIVRTFALGYIVVSTDGSSNINDIAQADVVMYAGGGGGGDGLVTEYQNSNFTAEVGKHYLVDTSGGSVGIILPDGGEGDVIRFSDATKSWATNNIVITPDVSDSINGDALGATFEGNTDAGWVLLAFDSTNSNWIVDAPGINTGGSGGVSDFPDVDFVINSNFDLTSQQAGIIDERGVEVTAPSTILLTGQTDPTENGIYTLTSLSSPEEVQITGFPDSSINGTYLAQTYTDGTLAPDGGASSTPAVPGNNWFPNFFSWITAAPTTGTVYYNSSNLNVLWLDSAENAWFVVSYFSTPDFSDSVTYKNPDVNAYWITAPVLSFQINGNSDISTSPYATVTPSSPAIIARASKADTSSDFSQSRKVKSPTNVYRYIGNSNPVLGANALHFDLFSTQFDEKPVSGNVGPLTGGFYRVNSGEPTTFGALKNVTLFIENTEVTFDSITDCKIVINNQGGDNVTFTGEINNSDIICHAGDTTSQVEFQNSINYSKILGTQTSNSVSCYYVTNFTTSWTAFRSNFNILGSIVFRTAPGPVQFTQSIIKCSNVLTVNPGSTFQTDFYCSLDINNIAATYADANTLTINGRGNIQTISWRHGLLDLKGLLRIGRINRSSGSNTPSILRASSAANVNVATVSVVNPDSLVIETFGNSILEIGFLESVSGPANIDGNFANGVIKINYLEEKTFDTQVPAQAMNIVASYGRKIWWTNAGVFGTDP